MPGRSLRARALQWLARREQSRVELRRKLLRHADEGEDVEAVLDWLEANRFLSAERFVESRVQARKSRFGLRRIAAELAQHRLALPEAEARELEASEATRAAEARERRFGGLPQDLKARATQARFLLQRGFSADVVHRLLSRRDA